jgi:hypothetical protein
LDTGESPTNSSEPREESDRTSKRLGPLQSRREFVRFNEIALRESRESVFWLSICRRTTLGDQIVCEELLDEARQLARIIAAIIVSTKRNGL